ncbi:MAG: MFS transporter [Promethearchaeota archaeon]
MTEQDKFNLHLTLFLSLGFFINILCWTFYYAQVSITLFQYLGSYGLVGFWIAIFNIIPIIVIPIISSVSDKTRTRFGRRMPYLMVGIPLSALFFILISTINPSSDPLWLLLLYMFIFTFFMSCFRSQSIALMPDFIKPVNRSKGYAVFNFMASIGSILAFIISFFLVPISLALGFLIIALIMVMCLILMLLKINENDSYGYQLIIEMEKKKDNNNDGPFQSLIENIRYILKSKDKSAIALLLAIFLYSAGYYGLRSLFSVYATDVLKLERSLAGTLLIFLSLSFLLMTIPSGIIGTKIGRKLTIKIGLIEFFFGMILCHLFQTPLMIIIGLIIAGVGFSFIVIHVVVILWELLPSSKNTGTSTGLYFLAIFIGAILGPTIVGFIIDFLGTDIFFLIISLFFIAALVSMFFVKGGEARDVVKRD